MKKLLIVLLTLCLFVLNGCSKESNDTSAPNVEDNISVVSDNYGYKDKLKEIDQYLFEVEEYTSLDYDVADAFYAKANDNWDVGCSSISKIIDGKRFVGRNMDQSISYKCAYIVRTNAGKYKTVGLAYTHRDYSPDYEEIAEKGISEEFYKSLPFMCDDVLNDAGLHIEINMRHGEYWPNGEDKFACSGTNPDSTHRVYMFEIPRYIGENCATVEEAKEYVSTLNVYSQNHYWNYCFLVSDSKGQSSLLEFSKDQVFWLDEDKIDTYDWLKVYNMKAIGQTNFYLSKLAWYAQDIKSGEGRFVTLQKGIDAVNSKNDMYDLMRKVQYSSFYLDYDECKNNHFDPRSENIGEVSWATYDLVMDPGFEEQAKEIINEINAGVKDMPRKEKQDLNVYWESIFTEVVDVYAKEIFVRLYENEDMLYLIDLNTTTKLNSIDEWK